MIIGFLGKGGSGKTTLATLYTKYLLDKDNFSHIADININGHHVVALDNDHNMDFKFNLGYEGDLPFWMGRSLQEIFERVAIKSTKDVANLDDEYCFEISEQDKIFNKYAVKHNLEIKTINEDGKENVKQADLHLMVSGPHTDDMMYGNMCSHGLTTPLKVYLPLLKLKDNEFVIVDEKAGTDGVGTGVTTGFNLACVVAEATIHGIKAAKQIIDMLKFYKTPYVIMINKIRDLDMKNGIYKWDKEFEVYSDCLGILHFNFDERNLDLKLTKDNKQEFKKLYEIAKKINDDRRERTKRRIKSQEEFNRNKE